MLQGSAREAAAAEPGEEGDVMAEKQPSTEDLKAKMREALQKKQGSHHPDDSAASKSKAHGPEVIDGAPKVHRRKAGGGGS